MKDFPVECHSSPLPGACIESYKLICVPDNRFQGCHQPPSMRGGVKLLVLTTTPSLQDDSSVCSQ